MATKTLHEGIYASSVTTIKTNDDNYSGNSPKAYCGMNSTNKFHKENVALLIFDTSDFLTSTALKHAKEFHAFVDMNGNSFFVRGVNAMIRSDRAALQARVFSTSKSVGEAAKFTNKTFKASSTKKEESNWIFGASSSSDFKNVNSLKNKTTIIRLNTYESEHVTSGGKKFLEYDSATFTKSNCTLHVYYDVPVPEVSDGGNSDEICNKLPFTLSFEYKNEDKTATMSAYAIKWVASNGDNGEVIKTAKYAAANTKTSHTFPAGTFPGGSTEKSLTITFYVTVWDDAGVESDSTNIKTIYSDMVIPVGSAKKPINGEQFFRSKPFKFEWSYSDNAGKSQKSYRIDYAVGDKSGYVTGNSELYHEFPANTFPLGDVEWTLTVTSIDGIAHMSGPYTGKSVSSKPIIKATAPIDRTQVAKSKPIRFEWDYDDEVSKQYAVDIEVVDSSGRIHHFGCRGEKEYCEDSFAYAQGVAKYWLIAENAEHIRSDRMGPYEFDVVASVPTITSVYPSDGVEVNYSQKSTFTWDMSETVDTGGQKSWKLTIGESVYSGTTEKRFRIDNKLLGEGRIAYRLEVKNYDDEIARFESYFNVIKAKPVVSMVYPIGVAVSKDSNITFMWNYSDTPINVGQKSYSIKILNDNGVVMDILTGTTEHFCSYNSTLSIGAYTYVLTVTNNDDSTTELMPYGFIVTGQSDLPTLKVNKNSAYPLFIWNTHNAVAYEYVVERADGSVLFKHDIDYNLPYYDSYEGYQSVSDEIIENGSYKIKLRVLNNFGYYTEWADVSFVMDVTPPDNIGNIYVENTSDFGVSLSNTIADEHSGESFDIETYGHTADFEENALLYQPTPSSHKVYYDTKYDNYLVRVGCQTGHKALSYPIYNQDGLVNWDERIGSKRRYEPISDTLVEYIKLPFPRIEPEPGKDRYYYFCNVNNPNRSYMEGEVMLIRRDGRKYIAARNSMPFVFKVTKSGTTELVTVNFNILWWEPQGEVNQYFVCRSEGDVETLKTLGNYNVGDVDYKVALNKEYYYSMMVYRKGINYTEIRKTKVEADGVVIRALDNPSKFVHIWKTETPNFDIIKNTDRNKTLYQCLGRVHPIKEAGEWLNSTRSFNAYVSEDEFNILNDIIESEVAVLYQADQEVMVCDMEIHNTGIYQDGGRLISISLTQIEED